MQIFSHPEEPLEERLELVDDCLFFCRAIAAAEAGSRRHKFIYIGADCADLARLEGILDELSRFGFVELFLLYDLNKLALPLLGDEAAPFGQHVVNVVDAGDKGFDQLFLAAELR